MSANARSARSAQVPTLARGRAWLVEAVAVVAVLAGIALRGVLGRTPLWLDEAQTAAIAGLPLDELTAALRQDGHPPLYYVLLHGWTRVAGNGDVSLRALSAVFSAVALLPLALLARRVGGRRAVGPAVALGAASPFLIRYATEARMYALVVLLALTWWLAVLRARERPSPLRLASVAVLVAALLWTQYWSAFLLAAGVLVLVGLLRSPDGGESEVPVPSRAITAVVAAHVIGGIAFVPWLSSLLVQLRHTGNPWAVAPNPLSAAVFGFVDFAGGWLRGPGLALFAVLLLLVVAGAAGHGVDQRRIELDLGGAPAARPVTALVLITVSLGLAVVWVTHTAFASRYLSVVVGFVLVLAGRGAAQLERDEVRALALTGAVALGLAGGWFAVTGQRSQGAEVAATIDATGQPGGVVVACPDQLGPSVARYLDDPSRAVGYPLLEPAARVDWTDYASRNAAIDVAERADRIVDAAAGGPVWLVWHGGYRTMEGACEELRLALGQRLGAPSEVLSPRPGVFEPMWLTRFGSLPD